MDFSRSVKVFFYPDSVRIVSSFFFHELCSEQTVEGAHRHIQTRTQRNGENMVKFFALIGVLALVASATATGRTKRQSDEPKKEESFEKELCKDKDAGEWFRLVAGEGDNCRDVIQCTSSILFNQQRVVSNASLSSNTRLSRVYPSPSFALSSCEETLHHSRAHSPSSTPGAQRECHFPFWVPTKYCAPYKSMILTGRSLAYT